MSNKAQRSELSVKHSSTSVPPMRRLQDHIAGKQAELAGHSFFRHLRRKDISMDAALVWVPSMAFFVFAFQDILRVNVERVTDPVMKRIARHHQVEDANHDEWYLLDIAALGLEQPVLAKLFDKKTPALRLTRDTAYEVMSETYRAEDDRLRVVLLMAIEGVGHVFFAGVVEAVERLGVVEEVQRRGATTQMKYYVRYHLDVEKDHEMFDDDRDGDEIADIDLPPKLYLEACAVVDRVFGALSSMLSGFSAEIEAAQTANA